MRVLWEACQEDGLLGKSVLSKKEERFTVYEAADCRVKIVLQPLQNRKIAQQNKKLPGGLF